MPQKTKSWDHQQREFERHWRTESRALLWQPRTGKTKSVIDKACALYQACALDGVIVIAPNGVHRNWVLRQIPAHHWADVPFRAYAWRTTERHNIEAATALTFDCGQSLDWFVVNMEMLHDSRVKTAIGKFAATHRAFMLVIDESHHFAKPGSKRVKSARSIAKYASFRVIMTGTPVEENPLQAYAQFQILDNGGLGFSRYEDFEPYFAIFKRKHLKSHSFMAIEGYQNLDVLKTRIAKYTSVVLRQECEDLPPIHVDARLVELDPKQIDMFFTLKSKAVEELLAMGFKTIPEAGALLVKMQQIEGGFLNTPEGLKFICHSPKFNVAIEEMIGYTSLVWFSFRHEITYFAEYARKAGLKVETIFGGSPRREEIISEFQAGHLDAIIGHPQAIGEGYELSRANKILWGSQTPRAIVRSQANERASKVGTGRKQIVDIYAPGGPDEYFLQLTQSKTELADDISRRGLRAILNELGI